MNVLVIDDEKDIRDNISSILTKKGYTPTTVGNIFDARKLIHSSKWDIIISDIMIPHIGGFDLVDLVKAVSPQTPVVIVTGMEKNILNATRTNADMVLTKPFTSKQLTDAIDKLTDKKAV